MRNNNQSFNIFNQNKTNELGFTLIEMLVSITIFVTITIAVLGIYTSVIKANRKSMTLTRLQKDAQMIMTSLAKKVRQSEINYTDYSGGDTSTDDEKLSIIDASGVSYVFTLDDINDVINVSVDGGTAIAMPAGSVSITDLKFFIKPTTDPFIVAPTVAPDFPRVTIVMRLEPRDVPEMYQGSLVIQQTVPQRGASGY